MQGFYICWMLEHKAVVQQRADCAGQEVRERDKIKSAIYCQDKHLCLLRLIFHIDISHNGWRQLEINRSEAFQRPVDTLDEDRFIMEVQNHNIITTTRILFIRKTIKRTWHVAQICVNFPIEKVLIILAVWHCHCAAFGKCSWLVVS